MDSELQRSLIYAGLKLGIGLLFVASVIGVRIVTATPAGVESEVAELAAAEANWEAESAAAEAVAESDAAPAPPSSTRSRRSEAIPATGADRMVSCDLAGSTQFMRAADCGARGGRSTDLKPRK